MPIDCKSTLGLRAMALTLSGKNYISGCISVGYGVRRQYLSSSGFNCTTLLLFFDLHGTAVSQKKVLRESISINCTFCRILGFFYSIVCLQEHIKVILLWYKGNTILCLLRSEKNLICYPA